MKIILMCLITSLLFVGILPIIHAENVPEWVKNTAGWWATDAISEKEFVNAIEFLIKEGIIQVETETINHNKILELFEKRVENIDEEKPQNEKIAALSSSYNSFGFRGTEFSKEKPDDIFRIFAIGGSTTFGVGVENEFTWPSYLQVELDSIESNKEIEVINAGIPAASVYQNSKLIKEKILELEPNLLVLYEIGNDAECMIPNYHNTFTKWEIPAGKCGEHPTNEHPQFLADVFNEICIIGKQNEVETIVTLQPILNFNSKILTNQEIDSYFIQPRNAFMLDNHLTIVNEVPEKTVECDSVNDLTHIFDDHDIPLYFDRIHVGKLGNKIIAENILELIKPILEEKEIIQKNVIKSKTKQTVLLTKKDLSESDFSNQNLEDIDFFGSNLGGSDFSNSNLNNIDFQLADLRNVNFENAKLNNISFRQNDFHGTDFSGVDFTNVDLVNIDLSNSNLENTIMKEKDFRSVFIHKANLSGADLSSSNFKSMLLRDVDLTNANLTGATLSSVDLSLIKNKSLAGADLSFASLAYTDLTDVDLSESILFHTNFWKADLSGQDFTVISNAATTGAIFTDANLSNTNFEGVNLSPVEFFTNTFKNKADQINLGTKDLVSNLFGNEFTADSQIFLISKEVRGNDLIVSYLFFNNFKNTNLENANFKNTEMWYANFNSANLSNADLSGADLRNTFLGNTDLSNANLSGANLEGAILYNATLTAANLNCIGHEICTVN